MNAELPLIILDKESENLVEPSDYSQTSFSEYDPESGTIFYSLTQPIYEFIDGVQFIVGKEDLPIEDYLFSNLEDPSASTLNACQVYEFGKLTHLVLNDRTITYRSDERTIADQKPHSGFQSELERILKDRINSSDQGAITFQFYSHSDDKR